jgi:hypothetical protein
LVTIFALCTQLKEGATGIGVLDRDPGINSAKYRVKLCLRDKCIIAQYNHVLHLLSDPTILDDVGTSWLQWLPDWDINSTR